MPTKFGLAGIGLRGNLEVVKKSLRTNELTDGRPNLVHFQPQLELGIELRLSCAILYFFLL